MIEEVGNEWDEFGGREMIAPLRGKAKIMPREIKTIEIEMG